MHRSEVGCCLERKGDAGREDCQHRGVQQDVSVKKHKKVWREMALKNENLLIENQKLLSSSSNEKPNIFKNFKKGRKGLQWRSLMEKVVYIKKVIMFVAYWKLKIVKNANFAFQILKKIIKRKLYKLKKILICIRLNIFIKIGGQNGRG